MVKVHVLSLQITFIHPNVSTDPNCFTKALFFANLHEAKLNAILTSAGNPSGIIAAAIPTANIKASLTEKCNNNATITKIIHIIIVPIITFLEMFCISFCNVVVPGIVSCESEAILHNSVSIPVENTTPYQLPVDTVVHI